MLFNDFILYLALFIFVLYVTRVSNMWGVNKGTKKSKKDVKAAIERQKNKYFLLGMLTKSAWVANNVGFGASASKLKDYKYKIERMHIYLKLLNRNIAADELIGLLGIIQFCSILSSILLSLLTGSVVWMILCTGALAPLLFIIIADFIISAEDEELENDFPDLFLLLYSRLLKGAYIRLAPSLDDYIRTLDIMYGNTSHKVIRCFVVDLRNNIEIYGDDSLAVHTLREVYKSAMMINFCNLAVQSLKGVDNKEKLFAFKLELSQKRMNQMKLRAEKLVETGRRSIYAVYFILVQFIVLSWYAKIAGS